MLDPLGQAFVLIQVLSKRPPLISWTAHLCYFGDDIIHYLILWRKQPIWGTIFDTSSKKFHTQKIISLSFDKAKSTIFLPDPGLRSRFCVSALVWMIQKHRSRQVFSVWMASLTSLPHKVKVQPYQILCSFWSGRGLSFSFSRSGIHRGWFSGCNWPPASRKPSASPPIPERESI